MLHRAAGASRRPASDIGRCQGGGALAFTTSAGKIAELRQRVQRMAEMHNQHYAAGGVLMGGEGSASASMSARKALHLVTKGTDRVGILLGGGMMVTAATASVEDIEGGTRLVVRPKNLAQFQSLRELARILARRMARGECPMMSPIVEGQAPPGN